VEDLCITKSRLLFVPWGGLVIAVGVGAAATGMSVPIGLAVAFGGLLWTLDNAVVSRICVTSSLLTARDRLGFRKTSISLHNTLLVDIAPWGFGGVGASVKEKLVISSSGDTIELSPLNVYHHRDVTRLIDLLCARSRAVTINDRVSRFVKQLVDEDE